jgi:uncharacterized membrane protein HdeD (DUF308 family)
MPLLLRLLCIALSILFVAQAALSPVVEEGFYFLVIFALNGGLLWLLWAFWNRRESTLSWLSIYSAIAVLFGVVFIPLTTDLGPWTWLFQAQLIAETVVCLALCIVLRRDSTKSWFHGTKPEQG